MLIYLDNAGTTKVSETVKQAMLPYLDEIYGNASSLHSIGQLAKEKLEEARQTIADCIGAKAEEIYFTSGGSESDNWAIDSACKYAKLTGKTHIITSSFEHHAILHTLEQKKKEGFSVTYLPVYKNGIVNPKDLESAITDKTFLVTIMTANNEIGTIQPISEIGEICRKHKIIFHTDAVQAVGHLPINVNEMHIDMLSMSGHKFHSPKGIGALYCKLGTPLFNFIYGGAQERNKRAGTENLAGIVGMATALKDAVCKMNEVSKNERYLRDKLFSSLSKIPHSIINGDTKNRLSNNFNMSFEGIEGESLLLLLDDNGICASSGSACTSGSLDPSHVLLAIGLPHEIAHGSLRLTLSKYTTEEEINKTIEIVPKVVEYLRQISPVWDKLKKGEQNHVI
ncbi:MAG: cysteine desulfurase NifS [Christensenellales bacterium]